MNNDRISVADLAGTIVTNPTVLVCNEEVFYSFVLASQRPKGIIDSINVQISRYLFDRRPQRGEQVHLVGQIRTYQERVQDKSHLKIIFFGIDTEVYREDVNTATFTGFVCKNPQYRSTPLGKEICDLMIAVNRSEGKSDYLPCIAWGKQSHLAKTLPIGTEVRIRGRLQSREYTKVDAEGNHILKTAYEISIHNLCPLRSRC